jgi:hypothetical protein
VTADYVNPAGVVTRRLVNGLQTPPELEQHMMRGSQLAFILRRSQIQEFIHAKPAERYRSLAELIGADQLENTQSALKAARDAAERRLVQLEAQLAQLERQLENVPNDAEESIAPLTEANEAFERLGLPDYRLESANGVAPLRSAVLRRVANRQPDARQTASRELQNELTRDLGGEQLQDRIEGYLAQFSPGRGSAARELDLELLQLLRKGRDLLRSREDDHCPLCQQAVDTGQLLGRVARRLADLEQVGLRQQRLDQARDALESALQDTATRLLVLQRVLKAAEVEGGNIAGLSNGVAMVRESIRQHAEIESREMAGRLNDELQRWTRWSTDIRQKLEQELASREVDAGTERMGQVLEVLDRLQVREAGAARGQKERERLEQERARLQREIAPRRRELSLADRAFKTFVRVKNAEIQRLYDELQSDLIRLYDLLHPGEAHNMVAIAMDPQKRGSTELRMGFFDRPEEDPRAFGSEGHLDSLGLCIFLAFVKRFNGDWPLLVLDDVVTSVDIQHKRRVADLLFEEFGDRQLFVTTHDARWFNELRRAQEETGHSSDTTNIAIEGWTLEEGPRLRVAG